MFLKNKVLLYNSVTVLLGEKRSFHNTVLAGNGSVFVCIQIRFVMYFLNPCGKSCSFICRNVQFTVTDNTEQHFLKL